MKEAGHHYSPSVLQHVVQMHWDSAQKTLIWGWMKNKVATLHIFTAVVTSRDELMGF